MIARCERRSFALLKIICSGADRRLFIRRVTYAMLSSKKNSGCLTKLTTNV